MPGVANNLLPTSTTQSSGDGALAKVVTASYDDVGNTIAIDGPLPGTADTSVKRYDAVRQLIGTVDADPDGSGSLKHRALRYTFDANGQVVSIERGSVNGLQDGDWTAMSVLELTAITYDASGRKIKEALIADGTPYMVEQYSYDAVGRHECTARRMNPAQFGALPNSACILGSSGPFGSDRVTKNLYDAVHRIAQVQGAVGTPAQRNEFTKTYTPNGVTATVADGKGNLTTYQYDGFDRLVKTRFPSATSSGVSSTTDFEQMTYDQNSNVTSLRRRNGQFIYIVSDNLNRITLKNLPVTSSEDVYFSYDNLGNLRSARHGSSSGPGTVIEYDALGRTVSRTTLGRRLAYQYDLAGNRTRLTHPDGFYVSYNYYTTGQLAKVTDSTLAVLASYSYNDLGRRTGLIRNNGTKSSYTYDPVGRLSILAHDLSGTTYDSTVSLTYSPASQIVSRTESNDAKYSWTPTGNATFASAFNGLNQLTKVGSTSVTHDSLGNLTTGSAAAAGAWTYGYDVENQLRSATSGTNTVGLSYGPAGLLSEVTINGTGTRFLYDDSALVAEYNEAGAVLKRYIHGNQVDEPLVWYQGAGTTDRRHLHSDERGSIIATSNSSGAGTLSLSYSPYGESNISASVPFGYTGQAWLHTIGLYYYKTRLYSPKLGRFLQTDSVGYADDFNLYVYTANDPLNNIDPTGTICVRGVNYSSATCARSMRYERTDSDPRVSSKTSFFGAAAIVTSALALPAPSSFMSELSGNLETANMDRAAQIRSGTLYASGSVQDNDKDFIHFEQSIVQKALDGYAESDPDGYKDLINEINNMLNSRPVARAAGFSDPNFAKGLAAAKEQLGGKIDFANQQHREALGQSIADIARSTIKVCVESGIFRSC
jgi:RHS repeat-associated protein